MIIIKTTIHSVKIIKNKYMILKTKNSKHKGNVSTTAAMFYMHFGAVNSTQK